ncbi:hypothetical protein LWI28_013460 [Acer negundo]|uniref:DUF1677 family protein n=1 Tax=Acer negundo TaxID=4023 RepID=A0AAD5IDT6_ACENE|nr:hypothetical protein LWI28_013460 [Acer negundo]KAK4838967.1 hypothetical protein QYF36_017956 [Acer negundo]
MAPHGEAIGSTFISSRSNFSRPPKLSNDNLQRTISDISFELMSKEALEIQQGGQQLLPPISEVENAKCECCGMSEECTPEYIEKVRSRFSGKWVCGLCSEAVKEEMVKNGGKGDEALNTHMSACARFNKFGRAYPVLFQAEAMRKMLKKNSARGGVRAKSISPRDIHKGGPIKGGITRSSSCIPAITREINDLTLAN